MRDKRPTLYVVEIMTMTEEDIGRCNDCGRLLTADGWCDVCDQPPEGHPAATFPGEDNEPARVSMGEYQSTSTGRSVYTRSTRENGLVEIVCPHGVSHPSVRLTPTQYFYGVHRCDGCCTQVDWQTAEQRFVTDHHRLPSRMMNWGMAGYKDGWDAPDDAPLDEAPPAPAGTDGREGLHFDWAANGWQTEPPPRGWLTLLNQDRERPCRDSLNGDRKRERR